MIRPTTLNLHEFDESSFVNGCYIPHKVCDDLINYFEDNPKRQRSGKIWRGISTLTEDDNVKESMDINFDIYNSDDKNILDDYVENLNLCVKEYEYKYSRAQWMASFALQESIQIQKYEPGGGFKTWHCERTGKAQMTRCLAFMTYLNDVPMGGTNFMYQKITTPAKKGLTLIWPTDWTHTHKGQISQTHKKYVITGWFNYIK